MGKNVTYGRATSLTIKEQRESLPIYKLRSQLLQAVHDNQVLVVIGETGSGRCTGKGCVSSCCCGGRAFVKGGGVSLIAIALTCSCVLGFCPLLSFFFLSSGKTTQMTQYLAEVRHNKRHERHVGATKGG